MKLDVLFKKYGGIVLVFVVLMAIVWFAGQLYVIDYTNVTVKIVTEDGYVSILQPNPRYLHDSVAWDDHDLTITVAIELSDQVLVINSFGAVVKEESIDYDTGNMITRGIVSENSYTIEGKFILIEMYISENLITRDEMPSGDLPPAYWLAVSVIGVDYREEFSANFDYYYFYCHTPQDYIDYYIGDNPTSEPMFEPPTEPIFEDTITSTEEIGTTGYVPSPINGFGFLIVILPLIMVCKRGRNKND